MKYSVQAKWRNDTISFTIDAASIAHALVEARATAETAFHIEAKSNFIEKLYSIRPSVDVREIPESVEQRISWEL